MVTILKNNESLTPYVFYTSFLRDVALYIKDNNNIEFKLFENGDNFIYESKYRIDPITIPLLLSLMEQLSKFYEEPLKFHLFNNKATKDSLNFLFKSGFFNIAGSNNYSPYGRNILNFDINYLGGFGQKDPRPEHRVRCYSLFDNSLKKRLTNYKSEDEQRDFLISEYVYLVREHFQELLFDNDNTYLNSDYYIEILSELITNGVLHSKSNTFALMFVNQFSTKFSISDNGIGFEESLKLKKEGFLYKPNELKSSLDELRLLNINDRILHNLNYVVETLFFSSLKDRRGLFDLMVSVVLNSNGYFRLHSENSQIIISNRMRNELDVLYKLRNRLYDIYKEILITKVDQSGFKDEMILIKNQLLANFKILYKNLCDKYNNDFKYSSLRFFNVKFRGVHIEVEIPNRIS
ncbi:hypothetical protein [Niabella aquatica]